MLPEARRRAILNDLAQAGSETIINFSKRYHVSTMTIRRDLKALQAAGYVTLTHGGAIYDGEPFQHNEIHHIERAATYAVEKRAIGRYIAAHFITDNDVLFLDAGTTVMAMTPFLQNKANLTIVSNSIKCLDALYRSVPDNVILGTGGLLSPTAQIFVGPVAERFFKDFFARKAIVSGIGFTIDDGLTDTHMLATAVKKAMISSAEDSIVAIDSSKIGQTAMMQVLATGTINTLVTDSGISDAQRDAIRDCGIDLHVVSVIST